MRLAAALVALAACHRATPPDDRAEAVLANGLVVQAHRVAGAHDVALVVLFDTGGDHDPPGKSGLAHLVEHVYMTAAAGDVPARTYEELARTHPRGSNAQTGARSTIVATVFEPERLDAELHEAAARMSALAITQADLDREQRRVEDELVNMREHIPALATLNLARDRVRPMAHGQHGGVIAEVAMLSLDDVRTWWARHDKASHAILSISGEIDPARVLESARAAFASVPRGEPVPAPAEPQPPLVGAFVRERAQLAQPELAAAWRAPAPGDPLFPAFVVLFGRLAAHASELPVPQGRFPLSWPVLESPEVLEIALPVTGDADATLAAIDAFVARAAKSPASGALVDTLVFGGRPENVYGDALAAARWRQLGVKPDQLRAALDAVTEADLTRAAALLAPGRRASAVVR